MAIDFDKVDALLLDTSYLTPLRGAIHFEDSVRRGGLRWLVEDKGISLARTKRHLSMIKDLVELCSYTGVKFCVIPEVVREMEGKVDIFKLRADQIYRELGQIDLSTFNEAEVRRIAKDFFDSEGILKQVFKMAHGKGAQETFGREVMRYYSGYLAAAKAYHAEIKEEDERIRPNTASSKNGSDTDALVSTFALCCAYDPRIRGVIVLSKDHHIAGDGFSPGIIERINTRVVKGSEGSRYGVTHFPRHNPFVEGYKGDIKPLIDSLLVRPGIRPGIQGSSRLSA